MARLSPLLALVGCVQVAPGIEVVLEVTPSGAPDGVERAHLAVASAELVPCAPLARRAPFSALAHTPSTPTRIGAPLVVDLLDEAPQRLETVRPPPADWCWLDVWLAPADADARRVTDELEGRTFLVHGPAVVQSGAAVVTSVPVSLSVHEPRRATLTLAVDVDAWLGALDWDEPPTDLSVALQASLPDALSGR